MAEVEKADSGPISAAPGPDANGFKTANIPQEHYDYLLKRHGTVDLHPLPSSDPADPYNWPAWKKNVNLFMLAFHAMMTTLIAAAIIPAYEPLGMSLGRSIQDASYLTSAQIIVLGVSPIFWRPISNRWGRRPVFLISTFGSLICNIGCAESHSYGSQMANRVLVAFFISPPIAIGSGVVVELFLASQRGQKMGVWTLLVTLGPSVGPFIFGFVTYHAGWVWIYWVLAIVNGVQFLGYLVFGSETRYIRPDPYEAATTPRTKQRLFKRIDPSPVTVNEILLPITIGRYLNVLLPSVAYSIVFSLAGILLTVEIPQTFVPVFGLNPQQIGLQFLAIIIGSVIGEQTSGPLSDIWMKRKAKKLGHRPPPEHRLWLSYFGFLMAMVGLIVFGVQLQHATIGKWNVTPIVGAGIAAFGNQLITTVLVTYAVDCHPEHSSSVGGFIAFVRQTWGFIGPFWFPDMFASLGYAGSGGLCAGIVFIAAWLPTAFIQFRGGALRARRNASVSNA